mmetsp:Transcript_4236/g.8869  ORF Transcript_4236/g.8869 Transcript_4236/m.8869 type:complete len:224 (+) Transcript_4236:1937-2608(+)
MAHNLAARINHGVEMLRQGNVAEAFEAFRRTLVFLAAGGVGEQALGVVAPDNNNNNDPPQEPHSRIQPVPVANLFPESNDISSIVYQSAFRVWETETDHTILSLVLLFNTALIYHSRTLTRENSSFVQKALRLYQSVFDSVANTRENLREKSLVVMASLNNASQLYMQLVNHAQAVDCFDRLRTIIELVQQFRIVPDDFQFFLIAVAVENDDHDGRLFSAPTA